MAWDWESLKVRLAFLLFHQCLMTGMYMLGFLLLFLLHSMFCSRVFFNQKGFVSSAVSVQVIINSHNNKAVVVWFFFLNSFTLCCSAWSIAWSSSLTRSFEIAVWYCTAFSCSPLCWPKFESSAGSSFWTASTPSPLRPRLTLRALATSLVLQVHVSSLVSLSHKTSRKSHFGYFEILCVF